jgi:hypothetical protein
MDNEQVGVARSAAQDANQTPQHTRPAGPPAWLGAINQSVDRKEKVR